MYSNNIIISDYISKVYEVVKQKVIEHPSFTVSQMKLLQPKTMTNLVSNRPTKEDLIKKHKSRYLPN
jgi:hypothetical protein